jgi:hypothetical protein
MVDVYRDSVAVEETEPGTTYDQEGNPLDPEWPAGTWTRYKTITDEEGAITGYTVTRRNLTSVEAFKGGWITQSPQPPEFPEDCILGTLITNEAMINTIDERLQAEDAFYGRVGEIVADD